KAHDACLRQIFGIRQRGRQPVRRVEADEPAARRDNAGAVLFQVLDTKGHGVDVDAIGITYIRPEMRYRLGNAFEMMAQGAMGKSAQKRLAGVEPAVQFKIVLPDAAMDAG